MPGLNTTGTANTADYNLGRGKVYFATLDANGLPTGYRFLGNAPEFNINTEVETLEHFSSQEGLRTLDKKVVVQQTVNFNFTLDELNFQNLALFFSGDTATPTNAAIAGFAEYEMVAAGTLALGRWYDVRDSNGNRAYDIDAADLTINSTNATPVLMALTTDYLVDTVQGRIFIVSTSTKMQTAVTAGEGLDIVLAAKAEALTLETVRALLSTNVEGALKFIGINPANDDEQKEYQFHKVSLVADGDLALIQENDWSTLGFTGAAETNAAASATSPTLTVTTLAPA